jgi:pilus assembly protein FimV
MLQPRRKLLPYCIAAALLSGEAAAVGMGEIHLTSYLGKPLQAEVALNDLGDLSTDQLKVKIGSESDYQAMGVEYTYLHSQLKIEPFVRNGRGFVRITTQESITEPYLNFVLNLQWPQGRVVREFTVLLDPAPMTAVAAIPDAVPPTTASAPAEATVAPVAHTLRRARRESAVPVAMDGSYVVQRGDSLWRIAAKLRTPGASQEQVMSAIVAHNPQAFINGDPDRIKEAARIVAPSSEQIAAANGARAAAPQAAASANAAPVPAADQQLAAENSALKTQIGELTSNVDALSRNLEHSEQRLHEMEAQLDTLLQQFQQQKATLAGLKGDISSPASAAAAPATGSMINQVNAAELSPAPVAHTPWWVHMLYWLGIGAAATWAIREHFWPQRKFALVGAGDDAPMVPVRPAIAPIPAPMARDSWRAPVREERSPLAAALDEVDLDEPVMTVAASPDMPAEPAPELSRAADDPVDASISAGVFLAFGRFDEAERLLRDALKHAPERVDLKLQLLDVYMQADKRAAFDALAHEIEQGPTTAEIVAELDVLRDSYRSRH